MLTNLQLVKKVDVVPYPHECGFEEFEKSVYFLYSHDGRFHVGYVLRPIYQKLTEFPQYFTNSNSNPNRIQFHESLDTLEKRENALMEIGQKWRKAEIFDTLKGWRDEKYVIYEQNGIDPYFKLERAMCPLFGVAMYGVHINGYVVTQEGEYKIWVPRRAKNKPTYPGMLDNTVAGGLGYPYGPWETCIKECWEEAGLSKEYVEKNLKSCGVVSYLYQLNGGEYSHESGTVQPEVEYVYDLKMDLDTKPFPVDHESEDFRLMDMKEVKERLSNGEFKDNCGAIIIDFMIRHGFITAENEKDFIEISSRLHRYLTVSIKRN